jgi:hypothetical protein
MPAGVADCDIRRRAAPVYSLTPFVDAAARLPDRHELNSSSPSAARSGAPQTCFGAFLQTSVRRGRGSVQPDEPDGSYTKVDGFLSRWAARPQGRSVPRQQPIRYRTRPLKLRLFCGTKNLNAGDISAPEIVSLTATGSQDVTKVDLDDNANNNSSFRFSSGFWLYSENQVPGPRDLRYHDPVRQQPEYQSQFVL